MLSYIRQMFSNAKTALTGEPGGFINKLAVGDVWILAIGFRGTPEIPPSVKASGSRNIIAANRIDVSEIGEGDSVSPFNFKRGGKQFLPFFSSDDCARQFASSARVPISTSVFQPYRVPAGFLTSSGNNGFELIWDAGTPAERIVSKDERIYFCSLIANAQKTKNRETT